MLASCTALFIGREARTNQLKLDKAGVMVDMATNRIKVNDDESTSVAHIYAIGDVAMVRLCCYGKSVLPWRDCTMRALLRCVHC